MKEFALHGVHNWLASHGYISLRPPGLFTSIRQLTVIECESIIVSLSVCPQYSWDLLVVSLFLG